MTETAAAHGSHDGHDGHAHTGPHHPQMYYVKTWAILLVLLAISIAGPLLGHPIVTLITAFGIAAVKAFLVAARFMHLNSEKRIATMIVVAALAFMFLFFFAVAPDVMKHEGDHWVNVAAKQEIARRIEREGEHGEKMHHGGHEGGEAAAHEGAAEHK
jgi:caa(3)-type oxidase subunit IV